MKSSRIPLVLVAFLSGALVSACGVGVDEPDASRQPDAPSEVHLARQPAGIGVQSSYAVFPTTPDSGSTYIAGQSMTIEWGIIVGTEGLQSQSLVDSIRLELYRRGSYYATIVDAVPVSQWTYTWQIPGDVLTGNEYAIHLVNVDDPTLYSTGYRFKIQGTSCEFKLEAVSLYVARDQRTLSYNYEGKLELAGTFQAADTVSPRYPAVGEISLAQGGTAYLSHFITTVLVAAPTTIPIAANIWELEHGGQGNDDTGSTAGSMALNCTQSQVTQSLSVTISDDSALEREGKVTAQIRATRL